MTDRRFFAGIEIAVDPGLPPDTIRIEHAGGYDLFKLPSLERERVRFLTAKDPLTEQWGVVAFRGGLEVDRWTPEEAIAHAADLDRKAKLCFRQGLLET